VNGEHCRKGVEKEDSGAGRTWRGEVRPDENTSASLLRGADNRGARTERAVSDSAKRGGLWVRL
jgi:hypothetical protein